MTKQNHPDPKHPERSKVDGKKGDTQEGTPKHVEEKLDEGIEESFPASDPVSVSTITPVSPDKDAPKKK